ncbi:hypothetical protein WJX81_003790 [Elliptochloris bilobata]|uniref:GDT1 family protein n=1 Tax=Elliptochloris bilobata TaxID=381761 RepID=A0AAW1RWW1_9CHLO
MAAHSEVLEGFLKSWGMILVSEIGDKTFFIAAIMAMRHPRRTVFAGALGALAAMTILSAALGWAAPNLVSKQYTHYAAIALFLFFGLRALYEAFNGEEAEGESELQEVERQLAKGPAKAGSRDKLPAAAVDSEALCGANGNPGSSTNGRVPTAIRPAASRATALARRLLSPVFLEAFILTFLAEWGDRSQIATIGLAASTDVYGVTLGGVLGHAICTGAAVLGGRQMAAHINERTVSMLGGLLFIAFGLHGCQIGLHLCPPRFDPDGKSTPGWRLAS